MSGPVSINGLGGAASVGGFFLDAGSAYTTVYSPAGIRAAANGSRPMLITAISPFLSGHNAARNGFVYAAQADGAGQAGSSWFYMPSGNAADRGWQGISFLMDAGGGGVPFRIGFGANGAFKIGRNTMGGNAITHTNPADGSFTNATLAGAYYVCEVPSKPLTPSATPTSPTTVQVAWSTPASDGESPITGYLIRWSLDPTFATGVSSLLVGDIRTYIIAGLAAGTVPYFQVLAINSVSATAGTYGPPSDAVPAVLVATAGDLDGWSAVGVLPAAVQASTTEGLRRSPMPSLPGTPNALLRENNIITPPATLNADTYGAKRTVTGLTIGAVYRLTATAAYYGSTIDANTPNLYALGVVGKGYSTAGVLATPLVPVALPAYEFEATATSHEIAVRLAETVTQADYGELERLALWNINLAEIPSYSPYRVQSTVYESSLLNHFDLACNSVGAWWWVDRFGITQFASELGDSSLLATFTDSRADGKFEYIDIKTSYDTRNVVNDLSIDQHGESGGDADDYSENFKNLTSVATWGARTADVDMSLYDEDSYAGSVTARALDIIDTYSTPEITFTEIRWNAQESPYLASKLEVYGRVDVEFRGQLQESRIVNIKHKLTPTRWIITLLLARKD